MNCKNGFEHNLSNLLESARLFRVARFASRRFRRLPANCARVPSVPLKTPGFISATVRSGGTENPGDVAFPFASYLIPRPSRSKVESGRMPLLKELSIGSRLKMADRAASCCSAVPYFSSTANAAWETDSLVWPAKLTGRMQLDFVLLQQQPISMHCDLVTPDQPQKGANDSIRSSIT